MNATHIIVTIVNDPNSPNHERSVVVPVKAVDYPDGTRPVRAEWHGYDNDHGQSVYLRLDSLFCWQAHNNKRKGGRQ